jgi:hypothetical protein
VAAAMRRHFLTPRAAVSHNTKDDQPGLGWVGNKISWIVRDRIDMALVHELKTSCSNLF